jgi:hypothetical protein
MHLHEGQAGNGALPGHLGHIRCRHGYCQRNAVSSGQSPEGHRVTLVRRGLRKPLPLAVAFRQGGAAWAGGIGAGQGKRRLLWDMIRVFWNQGVGGAHLLCVHRVIPAHRRRRIRHPGPCRDGARHQGQERGRGAAGETCRTGWAMRAPMNGANPVPAPATGFRRLP